MLNIAKQIYSGWNTTGVRDDLPEAEVIPFGSSSNEKKRLGSITKKYAVLTEHDNVPLPGYTLYKNGRKNYGSTDPTWLVIDPRGYLVRITNDNLEMILHVTGITEGLIQEKCVWARDDSQTKMILVPVTSEKYLEAVENTELIESKVNIKDVQIGDEVLLQNKMTGTYMGILSLYSTIDKYSQSYIPQVFLRRQIIQVGQGRYYYQTDSKILKITKKTENPLTREESAKLLNNEIITGNSYFNNTTYMPTAGYQSSRGMIKHVSITALPKVTITFDEISKEDAITLFNTAASICDSGMLVLENAKGMKYLIDFPYSFSGGTVIDIHSFEVYKIMDILPNAEKIDPVVDINSNRNYSSYHGYGYSKTKEVHDLDNFEKFYKIVKHVKKESYV